MKFSMPMVLVVLMVGLLALVPNVTASAYLDGDTWTGLHNITGLWNVTSKQIGGVIYCCSNDTYPTIQDAINASNSGIVELSTGTHIVSSTYGLVDGSTLTGLYIPTNVTLRGQGKGKTIIKQANNLNSQVFIYLSGKDSKLSDLTIDYNGFSQGVTADVYRTAVQAGSQISSDRAQISNVQIKNAVGRWNNPALIVIATNLYMAPYATINNLYLDTFDAGIFVTRAYDTTKTEYKISNIWAENGTTGAGFALHYEVGNTTIRDFYTNNSNPLHVLSGNPIIYNFVSRNPKGDIRIGTDAATTGKYEGIDIDGNGVTIVTTSPSIDLINPVVKNSIGYGISVNSGGYVNIINPICVNVTNSCINFESNSHGTIIGGNLTHAQQNGLTINTGSSVDVNGLQISNTSLAGANQFSGIVIAGSTSNNSTIRNSKIYTNSLMRYSVEMTGGNNNILENNWLTPGINGYYVLFGSGSSATQNRNTPGYIHGNSATAPTAFGEGDTFSDLTYHVPRYNTGSIWDWLLMPSKVYGSANVTVTNNNNGSITISSIGGGVSGMSNPATEALEMGNYPINVSNIFLGNGTNGFGNYSGNRPLVSTSNVSVTVCDSGCNYTLINDATKRIPFFLYHKYIITVSAPYSAYENVYLPPSIVASDMAPADGAQAGVLLQGNGANMSQIEIASLHVISNVGALHPTIKSFKVTGIDPNANENVSIGVFGSTDVMIQQINMSSSSAANGVLAYASGVSIAQFNIGTTFNVAFQTKHTGTFHFEPCVSCASFLPPNDNVSSAYNVIGTANYTYANYGGVPYGYRKNGVTALINTVDLTNSRAPIFDMDNTAVVLNNIWGLDAGFNLRDYHGHGALSIAHNDAGTTDRVVIAAGSGNIYPVQKTNCSLSSTAKGAICYNSSNNNLMINNGTIPVSLMHSGMFSSGSGISLIQNTTYGTLTINATGYNATYAKGGLPFTITNGTNVIGITDSEDSFITAYPGTITKLIAHSTQTGSINVSFWNASSNNDYIGSVVITSGTDASTNLNYAFNEENRIMFNVTSVTDIKKVALFVKTTKS